MSVQEVIAVVISTQESLKQERGIIEGFIHQDDDILSEIDATLAGNSTGHDQRLRALLQQATYALKSAAYSLDDANDTLTRVKMI